MPETPKKFYLTTPIYYVNARPHIGHAYTTIAADVIARRHRLLGDATWFLTGTDEHGQKIERAAAANGIPPQQYADEVSATFRNLWKRMGITNDAFIRTTDVRHKQGVQKLFRDLHARGFIELRTYTGQYSVGEEMFVDGPPGTIGPDGKPTETVSEENFFFKLSEVQLPLLDLIEEGPNGEKPILEITPESRRNEVLSFLRGNWVAELAQNIPTAYEHLSELGLPKATPEDAAKYVGNAGSGLHGRARQTKSGNFYIPGALKDLSISRSSFAWGVPVPEPAASQAKEKHVIYVWLDALANYMTAIGYGSEDPIDIEKFEKYWPADLHLVGKEIIRFHCVYWPAFLMAAGLPLPKSIVAHGWLLFEESKMSKSRGNVVRTETILDAFGEHVYKAQFPASTKAEQDLFASDVIRYFLLREIPFGQDGSFSFDALITRYNADLANGYGNLVSRTLNMIEKYFEGMVPKPSMLERERFERVIAGVLRHDNNPQNTYDFSGLLEAIWGMLASTDQYITRQAPWKLATDPTKRQELADVLYSAAEFIRIYTVLCHQYLPYTTAKVWAQLGLGDIEEAARNGELKNPQWGGLKPGTKLGPLAPIFPRADKGLAQIMNDMENPTIPSTPAPSPEARSSEPTAEALNAVSPAPGQPPAQPPATSASPAVSPTIAIDDFAKVDLRVAQIVAAERIPKADKLLRLEVDLGPNFTPSRRQILSGIAEWYTPEEIIGRRIAVIANLAPRKMRGLESHGMLLAASDDAHTSKPILASFSDEVPLGSRIR